MSTVDFIDFSNSAVLRAVRQDLRRKTSGIGMHEVAYLVKMYYQFQEDRIRGEARLRSNDKSSSNEPIHVLSFFTEHFDNLEKLMVVPLEKFVQTDPVASWAYSNKGIGPVLGAGLASNFSIADEYHKVTNWWRFAGLDPTAPQWKAGAVRPFSADAKRLCFLVGQSFVRSGRGEIYRALYDRRKAYETEKNARGDYRDQALAKLERLTRSRNAEQVVQEAQRDDDGSPVESEELGLEAYKSLLASGRLAPAHIDIRARRFAVKLFLSHLHTVAYEHKFKKRAHVPYAIAHLGHVDYIRVPNYDYPYGLA